MADPKRKQESMLGEIVIDDIIAAAVVIAIDTAIAVAPTMIVEGAKAYAINVGVQYATNGQDWGEINWEGARKSFVSAGIASGLGINRGLFRAGGNTMLDHMIADGLNAGIMNMSVGAVIGKGDAWGNFADGFWRGAAAGMGKWWYRNYVGFDPTMRSGKGAAGYDGLQTKRELGILAMEGVNNIGIDKGSPVPPGMEWFQENGVVSNVLNFFPGINAISAYHDSMYKEYGNNFVGSSVCIFLSSVPVGAALFDQISQYY